MKIFLIVFLTVSAMMPLAARAGGLLGISYDACESALGKPTAHEVKATPLLSSEMYRFEKDGWKIAAIFHNKEVIAVEYQKSDGLALSDEECIKLKDAYLGGHATGPQDDVDGPIHAKRSGTLGYRVFYSEEMLKQMFPGEVTPPSAPGPALLKPGSGGLQPSKGLQMKGS